MKDFAAEAFDEITQQWVDVVRIEFRFWKNPPSNGVNQIIVLADDGHNHRQIENIREIRFKNCY